jgi:hypothetical protein
VARLSEQVLKDALENEEQKRTLQNILHQVSLIAGEEPKTRTLTHWTQDPAAVFDVDTANP